MVQLAAQSDFATGLIAWQRVYGRHDLPWQGADGYRVWLSEVMLQQTQVVTVIPYYKRFLDRFPTIAALAAATEEQVLAQWSGLGYYARGRNLHRTAKIIVASHHGVFPQMFADIIALPGVGRSTAAAICVLAFNGNFAILDGNVRRLLARHFGIEGRVRDKKIESQLWQLAESLLPVSDTATYTQALMDMGAMICTRTKPQCTRCPVQVGCVAYQTQRVSELPVARQRKVLPEKYATLLMVVHDREIFLEKREPKGIWGGLWCLPQLASEGTAVDDYVARNKINIRNRAQLTAFMHTFTHFKLHVSPVLLRIKRKPTEAHTSMVGDWFSVEEALAVAIPKPVRTLLEGML